MRRAAAASTLCAMLLITGCSGPNETANALGGGAPPSVAGAQAAFRQSETPEFAALQTRRYATADLAGLCEAAAQVLRQQRYTEFRAYCAAGILSASPINDMDDYAYAADAIAAKSWANDSKSVGSSYTTTGGYRPYFNYQSKPPGGFWGDLAYSISRSMATGYTPPTTTATSSPGVLRQARANSWRATVILSPDGPDGVLVRVWFDWLRNPEGEWWVYPDRTVYTIEYETFFAGLDVTALSHDDASVEASIRAPFTDGFDAPGLPVRRSKIGDAKLAAMQERIVDTGDRTALLRDTAVMLLSLGYVIEDVRPGITVLRVSKGSLMRGIVTITPVSPTQSKVRFDAYVLNEPSLFGSPTVDQVDDPAFYQDYFFSPLSSALGPAVRSPT